MLIGSLKKFFDTEEFMQENSLFFLHESYTTNCILNKKEFINSIEQKKYLYFLHIIHNYEKFFLTKLNSR